jgi:uncharacterized membrane-anchored protein YitT (DUF2179 family)
VACSLLLLQHFHLVNANFQCFLVNNTKLIISSKKIYKEFKCMFLFLHNKHIRAKIMTATNEDNSLLSFYNCVITMNEISAAHLIIF